MHSGRSGRRGKLPAALALSGRTPHGVRHTAANNCGTLRGACFRSSAGELETHVDAAVALDRRFGGPVAWIKSKEPCPEAGALTEMLEQEKERGKFMKPCITRIMTVALPLGLGVAASAQSSIVLQGGAGQSVVFTGQGSGTSDIGVNLGSCSMSGTCTLSGSGSGSGALASSGSFTLTSKSNSILLTSNGAGGYSASASAPIDFSLSGSANGQTGTLLSGALNLLNFTQANGSNKGEFNTNLAANLSLTGGLLANVFTTSGGVLSLD